MLCITLKNHHDTTGHENDTVPLTSYLKNRKTVKKTLFLVVYLLLYTAGFAQNTPQDARSVRLFNFGRKFKLGETENAAALTYNDASWQKVDLPHDFQMEQPWDQTASAGRGFKKMANGWYRKTFKADAAWKDKKVLLDFEGLMLTGEVWFNGVKVKDIDYGYLGCEVDITKQLNFNGDNVVAVYASTGSNGNSRWYTGGGLFRDVHMIAKDSMGIARNGVFITTPEISTQKATVKVQTELEGITGRRLDMDIVAQVFSPEGKLVGQASAKAPQGNKLKYIEVALPDIEITNPELWSCESPRLYTARITVSYNGKVIDNVTETFGIRTIAFSKEYGFKLNGKKVILKGIANHHDLGALGAAVYDDAIERLFVQLKAFGYNHVRTSHNPYSKSFMQLADKHGILIVDELTDKWSDDNYWPGKKPFTEIWYQMVPEWIKRDRNHPSVILWSLGNELQMREDLAGFPTNDWGVTTYKILDVLVKRYDTTRKTTVAMYPARAGGIGKNDADFNTKIFPPELATVTEVASFNYRYLNYQEYLKHAPHMIIYQSEATTNELLAPYFGMDLTKMVGLAYWGAIAYWGESNGWPRKGWNFSYFNHALEPYPQAYLIKSAFTDTPLVQIGVIDKAAESMEWNEQTIGTVNVSAHWNREAGSRHSLFTYTNAQEVELFVNGKSLGTKKNDTTDIQKRNKIFWQDVPYQSGEILAVARSNGREVSRNKLETTGKAVALLLEIENQTTPWAANGMSLKYIKIHAVDRKGRTVPDYNEKITVSLTGDATVLTLDNGDHTTNELFNQGHITMHNGFALVTLRSGTQGGKVVLKAVSGTLKSVQQPLTTVKQ